MFKDIDDYESHPIFSQLRKYIEFYDSLSFLVFGRLTPGVSYMGFDTYLLSSIQSTLESIELLLKAKKINDAYALLRKYYDATNLSIYVHLYLEENHSPTQWKVKEIDDWLIGKAKLPDGNSIYKYLNKSRSLTPIRDILLLKKYPANREKWNDHMHYNYYPNMMINNSEVLLERRGYLDAFATDLYQVFVRHISYLFLIKEGYMMSTDYVDCMDAGMIPPEGIQYEVAPFVQEMFNDVFLPKDVELYNEIKKNTSMRLV